MILINSAAYVNAEFRNELGAIPPCFLPIGNHKLLYYQVKALRQAFGDQEPIYLSLPEGYRLNLMEVFLIHTLSLEVIFVPEGISLGKAITYSVTKVGIQHSPLRLLHGDTLLKQFPMEEDCIALGNTQDNYEWEWSHPTERKLAWCGYFSFSEAQQFLEALVAKEHNFVAAVHYYAAQQAHIDYPQMNEWYDLGHINTYFRSRSAITTQRVFNTLKINQGVVWKSGVLTRKIEAEAYWLTQIPAALKRYIPQLIQTGTTSDHHFFYETEYLPLLPLNEILVHGRNPVAFWEKLFALIGQYMSESRRLFPAQQSLERIDQDARALYVDKTYTRLAEYAHQSHITLDTPLHYDGKILPSLREIAQDCIDRALTLPVIPAICHGDLCFSNILFDSRADTIKVIDPRGLTHQQELSIYGNQVYDLAKLHHSVIGLYDFIIADAFVIERSEDLGSTIRFTLDERLLAIQQVFLARPFIEGIDNAQIMAVTILLFLSMLPLHSDKPYRQEAMLLNACRLYAQLKA